MAKRQAAATAGDQVVFRGELRGKREICGYAKRGWKTLLLLKRQKGFPMALVCGVWSSDTQLIDDWTRRQLRRRGE